jgi:signal transduction histidine kinase/DNA-binding response OmpR family regulator
MSTEQPFLILLVDDALTNIKVLLTVLQEAGLRVLVAKSGKSALEKLQTITPDLILLDVVMQGMDGFETCRQLKALEATRSIPVIFMTALSDDVDKVKGLSLGAVDYITKPFQPEEVLARVHIHLKLRRLSQELEHQYQLSQQFNAELERQVQERTQELQQSFEFEALLRRITDKVRDSLDENQILQTAVCELALGLQVSYCDVGVYDAERRICTIAHVYAVSIAPASEHEFSLMDLPDLLPLLLQGKSLQFCPTALSLVRDNFKRCAILACPLLDNQRFVGDLWLFKPQEKTFSDLEIRLVQQVANQCAIAVRQARLYQQAQAQVQELEKLNQLKDHFLDTVSHELRTPIANVKVAAQMIELKLNQRGTLETDPSLARYLRILQEECDREMLLVNDLLDLSRLEAEAEPLLFSPIVLQDWIPHLTEPFLERIQRQRQQLSIEIPHNLQPLTSDPLVLKRIVVELLTNACKYTPPGERIWIQVWATLSHLQLCVGNSGIEVPYEEQARIFDKFYRVPSADPYRYSGTGLGLALVKKLVAYLRGVIQVESESNKTKFILTFPLVLQQSP